MSFVAAPTQIARDFGLPPWHHPCSLTGAPTSVSSVFLVPLLMVLAVDGGAEPAAHSAGAADATDAGEAPALTDAGPPSADGGAIDASPIKPNAQAPSAAMVKLVGKVLARGTRQPLVGASLAIAVGDGTRASTETDSDGGFTLELLPGEHQLHVQCPGFVPTTRPVTLATDTRGFVVRLESRTEGERYENVVTAETPEADSVFIEREELVHTAGSLGDPFRVIESLPGVAQTTWPLPFYAIRGANPATPASSSTACARPRFSTSPWARRSSTRSSFRIWSFIPAASRSATGAMCPASCRPTPPPRRPIACTCRPTSGFSTLAESRRRLSTMARARWRWPAAIPIPGSSFRHSPAPIRSTTGTTRFASSTRWGRAP